MSDIVKLNADILCAAMEFVADDDDEGIITIAAISRTCKRLRFEGAKYLLSGTVRLSSADTVRLCSFCHFMLADRTARPPLLKGLVLRLYSIEEENHVRLVCEMLRSLPNLCDLDVTLGTTTSLLARTTIPAAIASLTSLQVLRLSEVGQFPNADGDPVYNTALRHIRSPLVSVAIILPLYVNPQAVHLWYSRRSDPIFLCSRLRTTLERLEADGGLNLIVRPGRTYEYPRLKQLILPIYDHLAPYLKPLFVSAPRLRDLQYGGSYNGHHTRHRHHQDILRDKIITRTRTPQEWRSANQRDQETSDSLKGWPMLESFKGAIIGAYAMGLSCPVSRVHLLSTGGQRTMELAMLSIVLSDWRPSFLRLATKVYRARGYIPLLPSTSSGWAESLETLEIRLNIVDDRFDCAECFDHIRQILSTLPVTSLSLEFCCVNSPRQYAETRHPPLDPFEGEECECPGEYGDDAVCSMQDELLREDIPQRLQECMRSAPTLRRMTLAWGRCWTTDPNHVICVDLDNVPHAWDRPGEDSDGWGKFDKDW